MARKPVLPAVRSETGIVRVVDGDRVEIERVYHVPEVHPGGVGAWMDEPDKVAWTDRATGLGCIVRRADEGHLEGFVGVDGGHALHGFDHEALGTAFDIGVHGGLDYGRPCEAGPESRSVCHAGGPGFRPGIGRAHDRDDRWWFGFSANQPYDLIPPSPASRRSGVPARVDDHLTRPQVYRDLDYMIRECTALAAQLDAIAKGRPSPARVDLLPVGMDPRRSGGRP